MSITEILVLIKQIKNREEGVTAMEYGVIAAAMVVAIVAGLAFLTPKITSTFSKISTSMI